MFLVNLLSKQPIQCFTPDFQLFFKAFIYKEFNAALTNKNVLIGHFVSCITCYTENKAMLS